MQRSGVRRRHLRVHYPPDHVTDKVFTRVDVREEFSFLVSKMLPYYDR